MQDADTSSELAALYQTRDEADTAYHTYDNPVMTDAEYDSLNARISKLEESAGFPARERGVGAAVAEGFRKVRHTVPMMSLSNAFTADDMRSFDASVRRIAGDNIRYTTEWKIDGLSISLLYIDGKLTTAVTRGDGSEGEDVTANIRTVRSIPLRLKGEFPEEIEIRGEVYMEKEVFRRLNEAQAAAGNKLYANPRNAAAGAVRQLDAGETAKRKLSFIAYAIGHTKGSALFSTQAELLSGLRKWGFAVTEPVVSSDVTQLMDAHTRASLERAELPFDVDGVVHKVDTLALRDKLGASSRVPRWAIAHKFDPERGITRLRDIVVQVGRTGVLTPVAELEPVNIGGVVVSRATLHNADHISQLDLRIGDTVILYRSGDVIPRIESVVREHRPVNSEPFIMPVTCPSCGSHTEKEQGSPFIKCSNALSCPAQVTERIRHIASRDIYDIEGLGGEKIDELARAGLLHTTADLYRLKNHRDVITAMEGWGKRSVDILLSSIEARTQLPLHRFIAGLGIREVGRTTGKLLAAKFIEWEAFRNAACASVNNAFARNALLSVDGIGDVVLKEITAFFTDTAIMEGLDELLSFVTVLPHEQAEATGSPVHGITVVFTGTMERMSRPEMEADAEARGAKVSGSVSKKTGIVVYGPGAGSKLTKAEELGVRRMTEEEWWVFVDSGTGF